MTPVLLPTNRPPDRFYLGGARIDAFRSEPRGPERTPEDWIASVTPLAGETDLGRTRLPDGRLLAEAIAAAPADWLGPDHVARWGDDPMLLVKLLDAGQRLPVHAHPDDRWAAATLGAAHGKAEAWVILTPGVVHLGLRRDAPELRALVDAQDTEALLGLLHRRPVEAGDVVLVPPGVLHAVGEGVLLLEVQEPADLSILLEWRDFALDGAVHGHLGVGFDTALTAVETRARTTDEIDALMRPGEAADSILPAGAEEWFRVERLRVQGIASTGAGFGVLVVVDGEVRVDDVLAPRGSTVLLPWAPAPIELAGDGEVLVCRPPRS